MCAVCYERGLYYLSCAGVHYLDGVAAVAVKPCLVGYDIHIQDRDIVCIGKQIGRYVNPVQAAVIIIGPVVINAA